MTVESRKERRVSIKPRTVRKSVHIVYRNRSARRARSRDVKSPLSLCPKSPHKNILLHGRRAAFSIFLQAVSAIRSSFGVLSTSPSRHQLVTPSMHTVLCSVVDLAIQVFVEVCLTRAFLLAELPKQARANPDLLDAHFLNAVTTFLLLVSVMPSFTSSMKFSLSDRVAKSPKALIVLLRAPGGGACALETHLSCGLRLA